MFYWEQLTREANRAHSNNNFLDAIDLNQQALSLVSLNHDFNKNVAVTVEESMVNFLNIAESYVALGDYISANDQYENAEAFLRSVLSSKAMKPDQWHLIMATHNQLRYEWDKFKTVYKKSVMTQQNNTHSEAPCSELHTSGISFSKVINGHSSLQVNY